MNEPTTPIKSLVNRAWLRASTRSATQPARMPITTATNTPTPLMKLSDPNSARRHHRTPRLTRHEAMDEGARQAYGKAPPYFGPQLTFFPAVMTSFLRSDRSRPVAVWLFVVAVLVFGMVVVGARRA